MVLVAAANSNRSRSGFYQAITVITRFVFLFVVFCSNETLLGFGGKVGDRPPARLFDRPPASTIAASNLPSPTGQIPYGTPVLPSTLEDPPHTPAGYSSPSQQQQEDPSLLIIS